MELTVYLRDHEISAECSIQIKDEGIGPYEFWGALGNDENLVPVIDKVTGVWFIRRGYEKKEEDIPKCSNISVRKRYGELEWKHTRAIKCSPEIIDELDLELQKFPIEEILEILREE